MIEVTLLKYLEAGLNVPVLMEASNKDKEFITIEKLGGGKEHTLYSSTFAIQSWANTKYNAAQLNEKVIAVMDGITELDEISKVSLENNYDFTDTETKHYRYQAVFEVIHY